MYTKLCSPYSIVSDSIATLQTEEEFLPVSALAGPAVFV